MRGPLRIVGLILFFTTASGKRGSEITAKNRAQFYDNLADSDMYPISKERGRWERTAGGGYCRTEQ